MNSRYFKINVWIMKFVMYFFVALTVVAIGIAVWPGPKAGDNPFFIIVAASFVIWFLCFIFFLGNILMYVPFREYVLTKMTKSEPLDEREQLLDGVISKKTFLSTLSFLIILLFFSLLRIDVINPTDNERNSGQKGRLAFGLQTDIGVNKTIIVGDKEDTSKKLETDGVNFQYEGIPLDPTVLIFLILFWHMGSYYYFTRKLK